MASTLAKLLNEPEKKVNHAINKLEELSSYSSEDVRMLADLKTKTSSDIARLGLDPYDTTGPELFHALQAKLKADAKSIARALNYSISDDVDNLAAKIADTAQHCRGQDKVFALKPAVIKKLLRQNKPSKTMKLLGFRSTESMLKREDARRIFALATMAESQLYLKKLAKSLSQLPASDFESRPIDYMALNFKKVKSLIAPNRPVTYHSFAAVVLVWPVKGLARAEGVYLPQIAMQAAEIVGADSYYLQTHQFDPNFGKLSLNLFLKEEKQDFGQHEIFGWHHAWKASENTLSPQKQLGTIHPSLFWWRNVDGIALCNGEPVSLHLGDNLKSLLGGLDYDSRSLTGGINQLKSALLERYTNHENVKNFLSGNFDDTLSFETANAQEQADIFQQA